MNLYQKQLIDSLENLTQLIAPQHIPQDVIDAVVSENPWFTPYYIRRSLEGISMWLDKKTLYKFVEGYPPPRKEIRKTGVIAAGNIPLVGFHDVLMVLLSGNICLLKPSHQDTVLMKWLMKCWKQVWPVIEKRLFIVQRIEAADFLIATGSNNSARYFEAKYGHIPHIIRKNRYSVAILDENVDKKKMEGLCEDILLYNGLGCRNVSNLVIKPGFRWEDWDEKLRQYSTKHLNPLYLERVLYEKRRIELLEEKVKIIQIFWFGLLTAFRIHQWVFFMGLKLRQMVMLSDCSESM